MINILDEKLHIAVPDWVTDLESFRRWIDDEDVPEKARICYLEDEVWIDMSKEQVYSHVLLKTKIAARLSFLSDENNFGLFLADGVRVTNLEANFSVKPDGMFASTASLEVGQVRAVEGMEEGFLEMEGTPDMVLEVVSPSSVRKDTQVLRQKYWEAGIREYWLVDARKEPLSFDIFRHTARGYIASRKQQGWLRSAVFGRQFRLTKQTTALGHPDYLLETR